jgi:hypothetical protein
MKEQKQKEDDKKLLTDHFIGTLPPLLNKVNDFCFVFNLIFFGKYFSILLMRINYLIYYKFHFILIMKFIQQHDVNVILMLI